MFLVIVGTVCHYLPYKCFVKDVRTVGEILSALLGATFFLKPHYSICHLLALGENMSRLYQPVRNMYILFRILPNLMVIKGVA